MTSNTESKCGWFFWRVYIHNEIATKKFDCFGLRLLLYCPKTNDRMEPKSMKTCWWKITFAVGCLFRLKKPDALISAGGRRCVGSPKPTVLGQFLVFQRFFLCATQMKLSGLVATAVTYLTELVSFFYTLKCVTLMKANVLGIFCLRNSPFMIIVFFFGVFWWSFFKFYMTTMCVTFYIYIYVLIITMQQKFVSFWNSKPLLDRD